ncbi:hypothetical protein RhiLY_05618 [Ceratobasidium sp. AG-Ba]|nr:hypothetical protein RhiLY_05618 [Ceratobasidium sp. AG-Ba]
MFRTTHEVPRLISETINGAVEAQVLGRTSLPRSLPRSPLVCPFTPLRPPRCIHASLDLFLFTLLIAVFAAPVPEPEPEAQVDDESGELEREASSDGLLDEGMWEDKQRAGCCAELEQIQGELWKVYHGKIWQEFWCPDNAIDMSRPAFNKLARLPKGCCKLTGVSHKWEIVINISKNRANNLAPMASLLGLETP